MFLSERCWCLSLSSSIVFSPLTFSVSLFFTLFLPYQVAEPLHLPCWHKPRLWLPAEAQQPADVRMDLFHLNLLHSATPLFGLHFVQSPLLCVCVWVCACLAYVFSMSVFFFFFSLRLVPQLRHTPVFLAAWEREHPAQVGGEQLPGRQKPGCVVAAETGGRSVSTLQKIH